MNINQIYQLFESNHFAFSTDSRKVQENDIFFALKGENFNGNSYALKALELGASYAIIDEEEYKLDERCILVRDVLKCFQELATEHRMQFPIPVLAVAGSNGKTTSKELIAHVLSEKFKVHYTQGNFNNLVGVPITLLQMPLDTEVAVIEIGTNQFGEIEELCRIVKPTHGVITNIGKEHLEGFGDLEGVAKEESELYFYLLKNHGMAFVNSDDDWLMRMSNRLEQKKTYGANGDVRLDLIQSMPSIRLQYKNEEIHSSLFGEHNFQNIALGIAVGEHFGLAVDQIRKGIGNYVSSNNRSQIITRGSNTIIMDAYNANPSSVESVLASFAELDAPKKLIVLGDMHELGESSPVEHLAIINKVKESGFENVYFVGELYKNFAKESDYLFFDDVEAVNEAFETMTVDQSHILIKGSRGVKLEKLKLLLEQ
jgi:UDP-N-acetylmuramoyl-tripeptide--D-alanyl-D-alanine ligase